MSSISTWTSRWSASTGCISGVYQPRLQHPLGVVGFLRSHLGYQFASTALVDPISKAFVADIHRFAAQHEVALVDFARGQRKDDLARGVPGRVHRRGGGAVHRSGAGEERCVSHREAPQPTHRRVLPVDRALHRGDQPVLLLLRGRGLRAVLPEVQLLLPLHRQAVHQRQRVGQTPGHPGRDRSHRAGGRLRLLRRPGRAASHLRPAGRGEDRRAATQVAGDPAAPVHREGSGRGLPLRRVDPPGPSSP
jgi:hypothetical protein